MKHQQQRDEEAFAAFREENDNRRRRMMEQCQGSDRSVDITDMSSIDGSSSFDESSSNAVRKSSSYDETATATVDCSGMTTTTANSANYFSDLEEGNASSSSLMMMPPSSPNEKDLLLNSAARYGACQAQSFDSLKKNATEDLTPENVAGFPQKKKHHRRPSGKVRAVAAWKKLAGNVDEMLVLEQSSKSLQHNNNNNQDPTEQEQRPSSNSLRRRKLEEAFNDIRAGMEFTLSQCLIAVCVYMLIAILAFSFLFDHFTIIDSMYFAVVTFTTIGYGDLAPKSTAARMFTCFFALTGVACLGIALGVIGNNLIEAQAKAVDKAKRMSQQRAMRLIKDDENDTLAAAKVEAELETRESPCASLSSIALEFVAVAAILSLFAAMIADDPGIEVAKSGWGIVGNAIYYAIITASTVGYGDLSPTSQQGRLFAIFFIPVAVGAMGHWLSIVASIIINKQQSGFRKRMEERELTMERLEVMDADGDGQVTEIEFLEFMLVAMNKVDKKTMADLRESFERLDVDGTGALSKDDLIHSAKQKLRKTNRKLELSSYKQSLLKKGKEGSRKGVGNF